MEAQRAVTQGAEGGDTPYMVVCGAHYYRNMEGAVNKSGELPSAVSVYFLSVAIIKLYCQ